jgi:hypothetical protein
MNATGSRYTACLGRLKKPDGNPNRGTLGDWMPLDLPFRGGLFSLRATLLLTAFYLRAASAMARMMPWQWPTSRKSRF